MGHPLLGPTRAMSADDVPPGLEATQLPLRWLDGQALTPAAHDAWPLNESGQLQEQDTQLFGLAPNRAFMVCGRPVVAPRCKNCAPPQCSVCVCCVELGMSCIKLRVSTDGHVCACGLPLCARCSGQCVGRHGDMFTLALHVAFFSGCCDPVCVSVHSSRRW